MQKRKLSVGIISLLLCLLLVFSACSTDKNKGDEEQSTNSQGEVIDVGGENAGDVITTTQPEVKKPSTEKLVALTYDDGPNPSTTNRILTALEKNNSVATFFIVGNRIDSGTDTISRAIGMGCEIANHTYSHKYLNKISASERDSQINQVNDKVKEQFGVEIELLRAPGGNYKGVEDKIDMPLIQWSIDTNDWRHKDVSGKNRSEAQRQKEMDDIIDHVMSNVKDGDIILMHDIYDFTADMSEILIPKLINAGYKLVTVSEMYEAYCQELNAGEVYYNCVIAPASEMLEPIPAGEYAVTTKNGGGLNLRSEASKSGDILIEIPNQTVLNVTESVEGWAKVSYNGHTGWVSTAYLKQYSVG